MECNILRTPSLSKDQLNIVGFRSQAQKTPPRHTLPVALSQLLPQWVNLYYVPLIPKYSLTLVLRPVKGQWDSMLLWTIH